MPLQLVPRPWNPDSYMEFLSNISTWMSGRLRLPPKHICLIVPATYVCYFKWQMAADDYVIMLKVLKHGDAPGLSGWVWDVTTCNLQEEGAGRPDTQKTRRPCDHVSTEAELEVLQECQEPRECQQPPGAGSCKEPILSPGALWWPCWTPISSTETNFSTSAL